MSKQDWQQLQWFTCFNCLRGVSIAAENVDAFAQYPLYAYLVGRLVGLCGVRNRCNRPPNRVIDSHILISTLFYLQSRSVYFPFACCGIYIYTYMPWGFLKILLPNIVISVPAIILDNEVNISLVFGWWWCTNAHWMRALVVVITGMLLVYTFRYIDGGGGRVSVILAWAAPHHTRQFVLKSPHTQGHRFRVYTFGVCVCDVCISLGMCDALCKLLTVYCMTEHCACGWMKYLPGLIGLGEEMRKQHSMANVNIH